MSGVWVVRDSVYPHAGRLQGYTLAVALPGLLQVLDDVLALQAQGDPAFF